MPLCRKNDVLVQRSRIQNGQLKPCPVSSTSAIARLVKDGAMAGNARSKKEGVIWLCGLLNWRLCTAGLIYSPSPGCAKLCDTSPILRCRFLFKVARESRHNHGVV